MRVDWQLRGIQVRSGPSSDFLSNCVLSLDFKAFPDAVMPALVARLHGAATRVRVVEHFIIPIPMLTDCFILF